MGEKGYYKLLGISKVSTNDEIKLAYRKKAKLLHPDKNKDIDATKEFQKLNEAYEVLSNIEHKKNYDNGFDNEVRFDFRWNHQNYGNDHDVQTDVDELKCDCEDWIKNRKKHQKYDPRRLCKHLVEKIIAAGIPEDFRPFKDYLLYRKSTFRGVKLFQEIVFLKSSIVVIDNYEKNIYLHLKKQLDEFCSYQVFEVYKYKGSGHRWKFYNSSEVLYKDDIDGKEYINKRFNVENKYAALCNEFYIKFQDNKEYARTRKYKYKYEIISELLKKNKSNYTTRTFNDKLKDMGYLVKSKEFNSNDWIVKDGGLNYGINFTSLRTYSTLNNVKTESWYISSFYDRKTMSIQNKSQSEPVNKTTVMWEKKKFNKLLEIMDAYEIVKKTKTEKTKSSKQTIREEWLKNVSCHNCSSKNIHKKGIRQSTAYKVQRYQCQDCKKIFQEEIKEKPIEEIVELESASSVNDLKNGEVENLTEELNKQILELIEDDVNTDKDKKSNLPNYIFGFIKKIKGVF